MNDTNRQEVSSRRKMFYKVLDISVLVIQLGFVAVGFRMIIMVIK